MSLRIASLLALLLAFAPAGAMGSPPDGSGTVSRVGPGSPCAGQAITQPVLPDPPPAPRAWPASPRVGLPMPVAA